MHDGPCVQYDAVESTTVTSLNYLIRLLLFLFQFKSHSIVEVLNGDGNVEVESSKVGTVNPLLNCR